MRNQQRAAHEYHTATKLSPASIRTQPHFLDWENKPSLYKVYPGAPSFPLPTTFPQPDQDTLSVLQQSRVSQTEGEFTLTSLAQLLFFSAGLTKKKTFRGGEEYHFRAAPSAGALYPVEIYLITTSLPSLPAGVYHFSPAHFSLTQLRAGDYRGVLEEAAADQETAAAPATLIFTALYWRSAWKYRSRAYRYCFWDAGTMAAHALALATALSLPARLITAFIDALVEQLLGLDRKEEGVLFLMPLGRASSPPLPAPPLSPLPVHALPLSQREVDYPLISQMHTASALETREEVERWRDRISPLPPLEDAPLFPLPSLSAAQSSPSPLGEVILRRGSARRFLPATIPLSALATLLTAGSGEIEADFLPGRGSLVHSYLISNGVQGLPSGAYVFHPARHGLQLLREGSFRQEAGYLCLEQPLGATASVVIFFLADFDALLERYGNRGYRVAQLEAGIRGGRLYLAAYALGLGATGLTFYDDVVVEFFSPHAQGKIPLLAVAIGVPAPIKRSRIVPLRPDRTPGTF